MELSEVALATGATPRSVLHFPLDGGPRRLWQIAPHPGGMNDDFRMPGHTPREIV